MKKVLWLLFAVNLVSAITVYPLFSMATGAGKLFVMSKYRELDLKGITNKEKVEQHFGRHFADDWKQIPHFLTARAFDYSKTAAACIASVFALNSMILLLALYRSGTNVNGDMLGDSDALTFPPSN